jgi:hypothetical protein
LAKAYDTVEKVAEIVAKAGDRQEQQSPGQELQALAETGTSSLAICTMGDGGSFSVTVPEPCLIIDAKKAIAKQQGLNLHAISLFKAGNEEALAMRDTVPKGAAPLFMLPKGQALSVISTRTGKYGCTTMDAEGEERAATRPM